MPHCPALPNNSTENAQHVVCRWPWILDRGRQSRQALSRLAGVLGSVPATQPRKHHSTDTTQYSRACKALSPCIVAGAAIAAQAEWRRQPGVPPHNGLTNDAGPCETARRAGRWTTLARPGDETLGGTRPGPAAAPAVRPAYPYGCCPAQHATNRGSRRPCCCGWTRSTPSLQKLRETS